MNPTDPVSIVTALKRYVDDLRRASANDECITVTAGEVLHGIGLGQYTGLTGDSRRPVEKLCLSTLLVLGFEAGTRGKDPVTRQVNRVFRLSPAPIMAAASASQSSTVSATTQPAATEPARLCNTRPTRTDRTQRRMAAEKRARSGNDTT